jgi:hypothetical protein
MSKSERTLLALHALTRFEMVEAASKVAQSIERRKETQLQVDVLVERCKRTAAELRDAMRREQVNPALIGAMHRFYGREHHSLREWREHLASAQQYEQQVTLALAHVRNRERSLERAMQAERRKQQLRRDALENVRADDLWLQQYTGRSVA